MKGHIYTIYKIAMIHGLVSYIGKSKNLEISLDEAVSNYEKIIKSGEDVKHPKKRITDLASFGRDLGILIFDINNIRLTNLGEEYVSKFSEIIWEVSPQQAAILKDYIVSNPLRNRTIYAIAKMFDLINSDKKLDIIINEFCKAVEKEDKWNEVTKAGKAQFALNYLAELRLIEDSSSRKLGQEGKVIGKTVKDAFDIGSAVRLGDEQVERITQLSDTDFNRLLSEMDTTASIEVKEGLKKIRKYSKRIIEKLKELYDYQCQICGQSTEPQYGVRVAEAHHLELFSLNQNNKPENIIILCPNHHRLVHVGKAVFDRQNKEFIYKSGFKERLNLNKHL